MFEFKLTNECFGNILATVLVWTICEWPAEDRDTAAQTELGRMEWSERPLWRIPPLTAVKTRQGCFASCSCLLHRDFMNFWRTLLQDPSPPPCPLTPILSLFLSFPLPFSRLTKTEERREEAEAERIWRDAKHLLCPFFYFRLKSVTPGKGGACQSARRSALLRSLGSSWFCICCRRTTWLLRHSFSLSSVRVRRSSRTATVWETSTVSVSIQRYNLLTTFLILSGPPFCCWNKLGVHSLLRKHQNHLYYYLGKNTVDN